MHSRVSCVNAREGTFQDEPATLDRKGWQGEIDHLGQATTPDKQATVRRFSERNFNSLARQATEYSGDLEKQYLGRMYDIFANRPDKFVPFPWRPSAENRQLEGGLRCVERILRRIFGDQAGGSWAPAAGGGGGGGGGGCAPAGRLPALWNAAGLVRPIGPSRDSPFLASFEKDGECVWDHPSWKNASMPPIPHYAGLCLGPGAAGTGAVQQKAEHDELSVRAALATISEASPTHEAFRSMSKSAVKKAVACPPSMVVQCFAQVRQIDPAIAAPQRDTWQAGMHAILAADPALAEDLVQLAARYNDYLKTIYAKDNDRFKTDLLSFKTGFTSKPRLFAGEAQAVCRRSFEWDASAAGITDPNDLNHWLVAQGLVQPPPQPEPAAEQPVPAAVVPAAEPAPEAELAAPAAGGSASRLAGDEPAQRKTTAAAAAAAAAKDQEEEEEDDQEVPDCWEDM